jgi:hypothetical protein
MKNVLLLLILLTLVACGGGGGGGGTATAVGRVLNVQTGQAPNPDAMVSLGGGTPVATSSVDGSFAAVGPAGSTLITVDTGVFGVKTFTVPPVTGTAGVGDLWIGPEEITLIGRVVNAGDSSLIQGAAVSFAGRTGTTNSSGVFQLTNVAYSSANQSVFWGIIGTVKKTGFVNANFSASPRVAVGGVIDVGDLLITSLTDPNPPPQPYNIYGKVLAQGGPAGAIVTLKLGVTPVRVVNVGSDGKYYFWVSPGNYTISYQKGPLTAPDENANLTQPNQVIQIHDVILQ